MIRWNGALPSGRFVHQDRVIVELTTAEGLDDEGEWLRHCVGTYGPACVAGRCRIFSVRTIAGEILSTLEVGQQPKSKKNSTPEIMQRQHLAARNRPPSAACTAAVDAFLHAARRGAVPINMDWPQGLMPEDRRRGELAQRVHEAVAAELFRRWPALKRFIKETKHT